MAAGSKELFIIRARKLLIEDEWYSEDFVEEIFQAYKGLVDNWYKIDKNIIPFPYRALHKDLAGRLRKGYILDEDLRIGQIIIHYKQLYPSQLSEYEAEGAYYKDSVSELRQMFGESVHDSQIAPMRDEYKERDAGTSYETGDILDYDIGDHLVKEEYEGEETIDVYLPGGGLLLKTEIRPPQGLNTNLNWI